MNNQQRAHMKTLSESTLHWALGTRIAVTANDWTEALHQAHETQRAVQRLLDTFKDTNSE
jgi:hypothetical protein